MKWAAVGGVGVALLVGVWVLLQLTGSQPTDEAAPVVTVSTSTPSEVKPDASFAWKGTDRDPKRLEVPALGINAFIQNVGVDQNREVAVPNNVHLAGWYVRSQLPGERGLSVIAGHVDGRTVPGVFSALKDSKVGQDISVEFGDGRRQQFVVRDVRTVTEADATAVLFSQDPQITRQLTLVTCTGTFDSRTNRYDERVLVIAEAVS